jgi:DNA-directed RNA polymerase I subunit RPA1
VRSGDDAGYVLFTEVVIHLPSSHRKLLISQIAEEAAQSVLLNALKGINRAGVVDKNGKLFIQTDGVNFEVAYKNADVLDINAIQCNDIVNILATYGVEAARAVIASEVNAVFAAYGITSDMRHLGLLADYMTFQGGYRPLNRIGITTNSSPFLKMSFETTATFLEQATVNGDTDDMRSPSACIVLGKPVQTGTGSFDVLQPLRFKGK